VPILPKVDAGEQGANSNICASKFEHRSKLLIPFGILAHVRVHKGCLILLQIAKTHATQSVKQSFVRMLDRSTPKMLALQILV